MTRGCVRLALAAMLLACAAGMGWAQSGVPATPSAAIVPMDGVDMVSAPELARLLDASRYWRADVRKLVLRARTLRITLTVDVPIAVVDDRTVRLAGPVRTRRGEVFVPVSLLAELPRDSTLARLVVDPVAQRVRVAPPDGFVGSPRVQVAGGVTRVTLPAERADAAEVAGRSRARFRVRVPGALSGALPDSLPENGLVRDLRALPSGGGVLLELAIAPEAAGYRVVRESGRVSFEFTAAASPGLERFAAEAPAGPRALRVIVLDPGHGGEDRGMQSGSAIEKELTLQLARLLAPELERRTGARVLLTRSDDRTLAQESRAEIANRARADLVLALHFDRFPDSRAHGATLFCPPASTPDAPSGYTPVSLVAWRDVAVQHAVAARTLAEALSSALELKGYGPARVRERLPVALLGVNAPGVLLECATLSSPDDLARLMQPEGLRRLASAIADGVVAYQRDE